MMEVILVRHAIAHERSRKRWPNDALRPLTPAGRKKFRQAARGLAPWVPKTAVILTSPWIRARDTASMLAKAARRKQPTECIELAGDESPLRAFELLRARKEKTVVLVGHEPYLGKFMSAAVGGEHKRLKIEFKKGGAACIDFQRHVQPGQATLCWMLPPRFLRSLR
jgi:phosphohistidine phosphatase